MGREEENFFVCDGLQNKDFVYRANKDWRLELP